MQRQKWQGLSSNTSIALGLRPYDASRVTPLQGP